MKCDDMFNAYRMLSPDTPDYTHVFFSENLNPDDVLSGAVSKVFVPARIFEEYGEELPMKGDVMCVTDNSGDALCLIKVTELRIGKAGDEAYLYETAPDETGAAIGFKVVFS